MKPLTARAATALFTLLFAFVLPASRAQSPTALVRHAPTVNGAIEGSLQQMLAESVTLNGGAVITGDLFVPGTPTLRLNGNPTFSGTLMGSGNATPSTHTVTLNGNSRLRNLRTRTDAVALPSVTAPPAPTGTRNVSLNNSAQGPGDFTTLRNLTLNGNVGSVAIPPGVYGDFTANGGSGFVLGIAGSTTPAVYAFQRLTLNGNSTFTMVGPVIITLANSLSANASLGLSARPDWLTLQFSSGGLTLNGSVSAYARVLAPAGTVTVNGQSLLAGNLSSDRLTVNGGGTLRLIATTAANQPPTVALTAPLNSTSFIAPANFTLAASASDADGTVAKVEFHQSTTKLGEVTAPPYQLAVTGLAAGSYVFKARALDNSNTSTDSATVTVTVGANQPPAVALTAPAAGATFTAPVAITLAAAATDSDSTIVKIEFFQGTTKLGEATSAPFQLSLTDLTVGTYTFTARATDSGNASADSPPVTITVVSPPNQPPTVALTTPVSGTSFDAPATVLLSATGSDPDGTVARVEFFQGTTNLGATTAAPHQFAVSGLLAGGYTFSARVTDNVGATADSLPVAITVTGANQPPVVTLVAPISGTLFNAPAFIQLAATASDPDGMIAKVEFYRGTAKLGESAVAPFAYTWTGMLPGSYALSARAHDNQGGTTVTPAAVVIVQAPLPFVTDFEAAEGYSLGALQGQGLWIATGGAALTADDQSSGAWSVTLPAAAPAATVSHTFPTSGQGIVFIDLFAKLVASVDPAGGGNVQAGAAKFTLVKTGALGEVHAFDGDGAGGGQWRPTGHTVALSTGDQTAAWLRLTVRADFVVRKWDLSVGGKMVAYDLGFLDGAATQFTQFSISGSTDPTQAATGLDSLFIGFENPLFVDADKDGLDDAWERAHGLDPSRDDRSEDNDGDGLTNVAEYRTATDPADFANGVLAQVESLNGGEPGPDDDLVMSVRKPDGTPWANAPVVFEITSGERRISATREGPDFTLTVTVRTDAQGLARVYLEPL